MARQTELYYNLERASLAAAYNSERRRYHEGEGEEDSDEEGEGEEDSDEEGEVFLRIF